MLQAIIFDYNGVLVDDLKIHEDSYLFAAEKYGFSLSRKAASRYLSHDLDTKRRLYYGDISDDMWRRIFKVKTECYFKVAQERNLVFPDTEAVLTSLSKRYMLALISNTPRSYFEAIFPSRLSRASFRKPFLSMRCQSPSLPLPLLWRLWAGSKYQKSNLTT